MKIDVKSKAVKKDGGIKTIYVALLDLLLLGLAFFLVHFYKYGNISVEQRHFSFVFFAWLTWLVLSLVMDKFSGLHRKTLRDGLMLMGTSAVFMLGLISLLTILMGHAGMSRMLVYGTIFLYAAFEALLFLAYAFTANREALRGGKLFSLKVLPSTRPSLSLVAADAMLLFFAFSLATYAKHGRFQLEENNVDMLVIVFGVWLASSILARKFRKSNFSSFYMVLEVSIKSALFLTAGLAMLIFSLHYYYLSRAQLFGTAAIFAVLEFGLFVLYYRYRELNTQDAEEGFAGVSRPVHLQAALPADEDAGADCQDPVDEKIHHALQFFEPGLDDFIREHIDLRSIGFSRTVLMKTEKLFNLQVLENTGQKLIVNLQKINDMRFLNQYFLSCHEKLVPHGWIVGKAHTLDTHQHYFYNKFPRPYASILYGLDFLWKRVMPKLPGTRKVYFAVTRGKNRLLSRAEILGRLSFCGFRPVAETVMSDRYYFIAKKEWTPSNNPDPTYGPLVALSRSGFQGNPITVYKFRTMHPYSEYIQDYVYEKSSLDAGGKFKDDFRVTRWGGIMRKLWIDELPMIYNWLRGDMHLVGVRPLSAQYLSLYSQELQVLRKKVKPGLLPPYYVDMPKTLEEICASEQRYIESFLKRPFRTQWVYFWGAVWNIAVKGARSR